MNNPGILKRANDMVAKIDSVLLKKREGQKLNDMRTTNQPINIDANNVSIGNVKINWEVGKAYKTRCGYRAVFRSIKNEWGQDPLFGLNVYFPDNATVKTVWIDPKTGGHPLGGEGPLDIIGPWDEPVDADLYDYKPEQKAKSSDYAGAHMRDINTPDNRRPRVSLRTDAQMAHERAVMRLRQHKLARWGRAEPVRWEDEL